MTLNELSNPNPEESLPCIFDAHSRPISIGQSKYARTNTINVAVQEVISLSREFVYSIHVNWSNRMFFVDRQINGSAVDLTRTREYQTNCSIYSPARFEDRELG